jgi:hypothetical protein
VAEAWRWRTSWLRAHVLTNLFRAFVVFLLGTDLARRAKSRLPKHRLASRNNALFYQVAKTIRNSSAVALGFAVAASERAEALTLNYGTWIPFSHMDMLAVHAALLPPPTPAQGARLVYFGGSQFEPTLRNLVYSPPGPPTQPSSVGPVSRNSWFVTGLSGGFSMPSGEDLFCSGHTHDTRRQSRHRGWQRILSR